MAPQSMMERYPGGMVFGWRNLFQVDQVHHVVLGAIIGIFLQSDPGACRDIPNQCAGFIVKMVGSTGFGDIERILFTPIRPGIPRRQLDLLAENIVDVQAQAGCQAGTILESGMT